jgi:hypothetical protein
MTAHVERPTRLAGGKTYCACGQPWPCAQAAGPGFTVDAIWCALIKRGFADYDGDRFGFSVYRAALGNEIIVEIEGIDLLPFNPGEGPRALIGDYLAALKADGYDVRSTGREVIVSA